MKYGEVDFDQVDCAVSLDQCSQCTVRRRTDLVQSYKTSSSARKRSGNSDGRSTPSSSCSACASSCVLWSSRWSRSLFTVSAQSTEQCSPQCDTRCRRKVRSRWHHLDRWCTSLEWTGGRLSHWVVYHDCLCGTVPSTAAHR